MIRLTTFALWCLAAASVVYWGLRFVQGTAAPANAAVVAAAPSSLVDSAALARALGGGLPSAGTSTIAAMAPESVPNSIIASRFVITGIVLGKPASQSLALIGVDAKPARPFRLGAQVADGIVIQSMRTRDVVLSTTKGAASASKITLELPKLASATAGTPIPGGGVRLGSSPAAMPPGSAPVFAPPVLNVTPPLPAATPGPVALPSVSVTPAVSVDAATGNPIPGGVRSASGRLRAMREAGKEQAKEEPATQAGTAQ